MSDCVRCGKPICNCPPGGRLKDADAPSGGRSEMDRFERVINFVKPYIPVEALRELWLELDRFDTEAKREILKAARDLESVEGE